MKICENRGQRNAFFKFKITMSPLGNTPEFSVHQTCLFSLPAFYKNYLKNDKNSFQNTAFFKFKITMSPLGNTPEFSVHLTCLFSLPFTSMKKTFFVPLFIVAMLFLHQGFFLCPTRGKKRFDSFESLKNASFFDVLRKSDLFLLLVGQKKNP